MSTETEIRALVHSKTEQERTWLHKAAPYMELIAATVCGILILTGWLFHHVNNETLSIITYLLAFVIGGFAKAKEGIEETIANKSLNVEMLMVFAAIGSAIIGYWAEGAILIFIFAVSGALETYTMNKSNKEISSLMSIQPEEAVKILPNGNEQIVPVSTLNITDCIFIKPGERVPADGIILKGSTAVDEATVTGESIPVTKKRNDEVFAGTVNISGSITVQVTKNTNDTLFQKIITLVQTAQSEKSPSQAFIEKFEDTYVKVVLGIVLLLMFLPHYILAWSWTETFYRAMIFLVVASPCALVASIMPATLSAISNGARKGLLFKGGVHLENLAHVQAIAFDKTGTLTTGKPVVTDVIVAENLLKKDIILLTASIESHSNHPLAKAIVQFAKEKYAESLTKLDYIQDHAGWGITANLKNDVWKIGKAEFVGEEEAHNFANVHSFSPNGQTTVYVKKNNEIIALFGLKDNVREKSKQAIESLNMQGIHTVMITGDNQVTANAIAKDSHVHEFIAECLPENKVHVIKALKEKYGIVAMVGDGINDAPALASANIGIAMGEGTDVALETADVVLMKNDLPRITEAIQLSKRMNTIVKQNIIFSITVIMLLIISNFLQVVDLPFGVIGHEGSTILVILNSLRLLKN